ncbi:hypothetical protein ACTFIR_003771 [Dictyostelium discoideum]
MCKILELMHLPNVTQFWPMISSSERLSKVVNFWSDLIEILRKEEVNRCRVCKRNPEHHIFMWGLKYTDLCYPCVGKRVLHCKAIYFPWTNNDPHVVTTKQYTEFKEKENNIYFQKGITLQIQDVLCDTSLKTPLCIREKIEENNISLKTFQDKNGYNVTCLDGEILYPGISTNQTKPLDKYRGKETIPLSFIIDSTPTLYKTSSEIGTPIIFSPIINKLQLLPSTLNFIPMSVSVPELFNEPYLQTFNSLPLYKSNSFVICIGRFNNNENWSIPFYLIIVVDINYINIDNHYLLNS